MMELNRSQYQNRIPVFQGKFKKEIEEAFRDKNKSEQDLGLLFGKVYVDNVNHPNVTLVQNGDLHLYGSADDIENDSGVVHLILSILSQDIECHFIYLYSEGLEEKLVKLLGSYVKDKWNRYTFRLNKESFRQHLCWREKIPEGYTMAAFDGSSDSFLEKHRKGRGWWNPESGRFGRALLYDDEIVSECFSVVFFDKNIVEVGIETQEPYRRRGLAYLTAAAFIEYCLSQNLEPNWGCWHFKTESIALAKKLGFEESDNRRVLVLQK